MKTYIVKFYPLEMIEEANSEDEAEELAREDIAMGECVLEVESIKKEVKKNEPKRIKKTAKK